MICELKINLLVDLILQKPIQLNASLHNTECIGCAFQHVTVANRAVIFELILNTNYEYKLFLQELNTKASCLVALSLGEHGKYRVSVEQISTSTLNCTLIVDCQPNQIFIPLIVAGIILLILFIASIVASRFELVDSIKRKVERTFRGQPDQPRVFSYDLQTCAPAASVETRSVVNPIKTKKRLISLDAFRGFGKEKHLNFIDRIRIDCFFSVNRNDFRQLWGRWLRCVRSWSLARFNFCRYCFSIFHLDDGNIVGYFIEKCIREKCSQTNNIDQIVDSFGEIIRQLKIDRSVTMKYKTILVITFRRSVSF